MTGSERSRREVIVLGAAAALGTLRMKSEVTAAEQLQFRPPLRPKSGDEAGDYKPVRFNEDASGRNATHPLWADPFKIPTDSTKGALFVFENSEFLSAKNFFQDGPPEHIHHNQDEFFYVLEGEVTIEIARVRHILRPGDCILGPRKVSHAWNFSALSKNRLLLSFAPAGEMEDFFLRANEDFSRMTDPAFNESHGITIVGPPLSLHRKP